MQFSIIKFGLSERFAPRLYDTDCVYAASLDNEYQGKGYIQYVRREFSNSRDASCLCNYADDNDGVDFSFFGVIISTYIFYVDFLLCNCVIV